eukprot:4542323-Amphidinium_carterae.1
MSLFSPRHSVVLAYGHAADHPADDWPASLSLDGGLVAWCWGLAECPPSASVLRLLVAAVA